MHDQLSLGARGSLLIDNAQLPLQVKSQDLIGFHVVRI